MKNIFLRFLSLSILIYITIFSIGKANYYSMGNFKLPGEYSEIYLYPKELLTEEGKVEVSNKIFRLQKNSKLAFFTFSASKEVQIIDNMNYFKNLTGYGLSDENIFVKNSVLNDMFTIKDIENLYPNKKIIPLKSDLLKNNTEFIIKKPLWIKHH
ncbi:putative membrane protein [Peptoniphilus sp. ING2-D1G]|nr:putative membrane protein [Peptoniphilus sp. ING2-D1G]